ncbi:MAG: helix-turn-helix domain-containing protein [Alphaproteobacteria bacterium]|nr:helix-turn-helix domain-containing protein [Alphaproteobacteria bacterium]
MSHSENPINLQVKSGHASGVGALLRATRSSLGQDLKQVSQALRIRQLFLQAIEEGRFDALPGPTYALGFVRSYADFLGLDSEEVVRRFRAESSGLAGGAELVFPTPASEKRLPSGVLVAAALAIGTLVYGGWYAFTSPRQPITESVPEVPAQLAKEGEAPASAKESEPNPVASAQPVTPAEPPKAPEVKPEPPKPEPPKPELPKVEKAPEPKLPEPAPKVEEAPKKPEPPRIEPGKPGVVSKAPGLPVLPAQGGMGGLSMSAAPGGTSAPTASAPPTNVSTTPAPAPAPAAPLATSPAPQASEAPAAADSPRAPKVFGQTEGEVRVVLKANSDSWIQVRDEKGNLVATRLLKKDDTYRVPSGLGRLQLTTGDAGALAATVDGILITPSLGPSGSVRRDISLDPDRIKAGSQ